MGIVCQVYAEVLPTIGIPQKELSGCGIEWIRWYA
jgi:hypothetical protein